MIGMPTASFTSSMRASPIISPCSSTPSAPPNGIAIPTALLPAKRKISPASRSSMPPSAPSLGKTAVHSKPAAAKPSSSRTCSQEAIDRAAKVDAARGAELAPEKRAAVDRAVGIGAVKYADLRQDRITDYRFDLDRMLSLEGNTGPYLQMQYTRIQSIYRKGAITPAQVVAARPADPHRARR